MVKIWAILESTMYTTLYPTVLSNSLESIETYIEENDLYDPIIVYKELDGIFECSGEDDYHESNWDYWSGKKNLGHTWKNVKTGELDPDYENREDTPEEEWDDWEDGYLYEVYEDGKLVKTYFE